MDDAGEAGVSEDGEMMEADGADDGMDDGESPNSDMTGRHANNAADKETYRVFDTKFDEVIAAADLCDPEELTACV